MADPILEALAQAQNQALANNPYAQFGSVMGQAKNPYARADDPWGALAANAAQSLLAGMATGYGQNQVRQELNQIAPQLPALYADPMSVNVGDNDILGGLQRAAVAKQQAEMQGLNLLGAEERVKFGANPLHQAQADKALMDLATEWSAATGKDKLEVYSILKGIKPTTPSQPSAEGQPVQNVPTEAFKGPSIVPTQQPQAQPQTPLGAIPEEPVPDVEALTQKYARTMPAADARQLAMSQYDKALEANRKLKQSAFEASNKEKQIKTEAQIKQEEEYDKAIRLRSEGLNSLDQNISLLEGAVEDLPDYGDPITGGLESMFDQFAARRPALKGYSQNAQKALNASSTVSTAAPAIAGALLKEAKLNPVTEKELEFVLKGYPSPDKTKDQNRTIIAGLKQGRDLIKFDNAFTQFYRGKGLTPSQINAKLEQEKANLGGSFYENGYLKPDIIEATKTLNSLLGGGL